MKIYGVFEVGYSPSEYSRLVHEPALEYFASFEDAMNFAAELRPTVEKEDEFGKLKIEVYELEVVEEYMPTVGPILRFEGGGYIKKTDLR